MRHLLILLFIFISFLGLSQTPEERKAITANYDLEFLNQLSEDFSQHYTKEERRAIAYAKANNIDTIIRYDNGRIAVLQQVLDDGTLLYYTTYNDNSAVTINTVNVHGGGDRNLNLDGTNMVLGIWDGGQVRLTHQELAGRVVQVDNEQNLSDHATHVAGTMIASGVNSSAKGMAPKASLRAYYAFTGNDLPQMINEASNGLLISNHSYGLVASQLPDSFFGAYISSSRNVDVIASGAPYYLPVFSAGNNRNDSPPINPSKNGYDLITGKKIAKNNLCVAATLPVSNYNGPSSVNMSSFSNYGPADDGRIKPDIAAQGTGVFSCVSDSDTSYDFQQGTSMAAPAVSGSLALLQQHQNNMFENYLTAASIKALVLHTAREAGDFPGPDYRFGWGLMDTAAAADIITNKDFTSILEENTLNQGDTYTFNVEALDANVPLVATIVWTDPAGQIQDTSIADDPTPRLVNDLDIKITDANGTEYFPWKLDPSSPSSAATTGDNIVDNVEKIEVNNPTGTYTVQVTHKGNLQDAQQNYSLVLSGVKGPNEIQVVSTEIQEPFCQNDVATYNLVINSVPNFSGVINLSQTGLLAGLVPSFFPMSVTDSGSTTLFISSLGSVPAGEYPFTIIATSGAESATLDLVLRIDASSLANPVLVGPSDGSLDAEFNPNLVWNPVDGAELYEVEISDSQTFTNILQSAETTDNQYKVLELDADSDYFWRVKPTNNCTEGSFSTSSGFTTKSTTCAPLFTATDTPVAIPDNSEAIQQSMISIPGTFSNEEIDDINVHLDITHASMGDLVVSLTSPNGTTVSLLDQQCGIFDNASVIIDDKGSTPSCASSSPTLNGTVTAVGKLSDFVGEDFVGDWILSVEDISTNGNGGSLDNFEIEICYSETLSVESNEMNLFSLYPNPASGLVNISLVNVSDNQKVEIYDISGRLINEVKLNSNSTTQQIDISTLNQGIYLVKVIQGNNSYTEKLIVK